MNIKNFMIGDWVRLMNPNEECIDFIQLDAKYLSLLLKDNPFFHVEPIPLTEDILKANGFTYEGGVLVFFPQGVELPNDYIECHVRRNKEVRMLEMIHYDRSFKIDRSEHIYVHQFQHALRLVGLTDLADKFKLK